jgi:predicted nucleotidyltransferase
VLATACAVLGVETPALEKAAQVSQELLERAKQDLVERVPLPDDEALPLDVVIFGSVARQEVSDESDFDYLVVAHGLPGLLRDRETGEDVQATRKLLAAVEDLRTAVINLHDPGATGMFGQIVSAPDLIERIGLEKDTNETHTHRILLLEESVSIYQPHLREQLLRAMLERYLDDYRAEPKVGVPRFLLNDVERYWRTICVDYQAKYWSKLPLRYQAELDEDASYGWGLRYFKLLLSRKLTFVGTVTSLLLCKLLEVEQPNVEFLFEQFEMPALARFAQIHPHLDEPRRADLAEVLRIADEFSAKLATDDFRTLAKQARDRREIANNDELRAVRQRADELQACLERIFFSAPLQEASQTYLSF